MHVFPNIPEFLVNQMKSPTNQSLHMRPRPWPIKKLQRTFKEIIAIAIDLDQTM